MYRSKSCKECGAPLVEEQLRRARDFGWKPLIAAALSIVPGLGHLDFVSPFRGLVWFFGVLLAYAAPPLGYILQGTTAASAASIGTAGATSAAAGRASSPLARMVVGCPSRIIEGAGSILSSEPASRC